MKIKTRSFTEAEWHLLEKYSPCIVRDENEAFPPKKVGAAIIYDKSHPASLIKYFRELPKYLKFMSFCQYIVLVLIYGKPPFFYEIIRDRFQPVLMTVRYGSKITRAARVLEYAVYYDSDIQHIYDLEHIWVYLNPINQPIAVKATRHGMFVTQYATPEKIAFKGSHPIVYADPGKHALHTKPKTMRKNILKAVNTRMAGTQGVYPIHFFTNEQWQRIQPHYPGRKKCFIYFQEVVAHEPKFKFSKFRIFQRPDLMAWDDLKEKIEGYLIDFLKLIKNYHPINEKAIDISILKRIPVPRYFR
jgi:hypothetical protein